VLAGHSERRAIFQESSGFVGEKTAFALERGLKVMLCIGETLEEREGGRLEAVLAGQLKQGLAAVADVCDPEYLAVAYEPVWAIGTGRVAGPAEVVEAHALIRSWLQKRFPAQGAQLRIVYGGSVKPENSGEIIALDNVDGLLVGGASLDAETFRRIVLA
jgi:triosephosphate isomerase